MKPSRKQIAILLGLIALYAVGLGVRRAVLHAQFVAAGEWTLPFTLESALNFRRIQQVFETGAVPAVDQDIQYPDGIAVRETDTVGAEYVYAALARLFPRSVPLANRVRWIQPGWFCLGIPGMALWLWWWRRSLWGSVVAAGFYAVALSSVMRSTGQEVSHENFALPLLIGHLAFGALADSARRAPIRHLGLGLSSLCLAFALATWDLIQYYVLLWAVVGFARVVWGRLGAPGGAQQKWWVYWLTLLLIGVANPYLRAHSFLFSPAMMLSHGVAAALLVGKLSARGLCGAAWGKRRTVALIALVPLLSVWLLPNPYQDAYGHFSQLLIAKLRWLNHKPADPGVLSFDQRIMWVPALDSATWALTTRLFPAILWLTVAAVLVFIRRANNQSDPRLFDLLFFHMVSFGAFVLFVRFHVFVAIFAAGLLGVWVSWAVANPGFRTLIVPALLLAGVAGEAAQTLYRAERWGRPVYYRELAELTRWMKRYAAPEPVLASFGVSASILAYGECPIVLHPKFESAAIRDRVRAYGEALIRGTEKDFWGWANDCGAQYYVYGMGEFSTVAPGLQMRYFVNELAPSTNSAAWIFEYAPERATHFRRLWGNRKYQVYKIVTRTDDAVADRFSRLAREALERGDLAGAEDRAVAAMFLKPEDPQAQEVIRHVGSLRDQGFEYSGHEGD